MAKKQVRFAFGKNWSEYAKHHFDEKALQDAQNALLQFCRIDSLKGLRILDIGCGSGIHSLAAFLAEAEEIVSFDYDINSVLTAKALHKAYGSPKSWQILSGDVLDKNFMQSLGFFDLVYAWGSLHHTGSLKEALNNTIACVNKNGLLYIALYSFTAYHNNTVFGQPSPQEWISIKRKYVTGSSMTKTIIILQYIWRRYFAAAKLHPIKLFSCLKVFIKTWKNYSINRRGMHFLTDMKDWLGGYPMEFMSENACIEKLEQQDFEILALNTGRGNSEYLFRPKHCNNHWDKILNSREYNILQGPFKHHTEYMWIAEIDTSLTGDSEQDLQGSTLRLLEDNKLLHFAHCHKPALQAFGAGRYRHEKGILFFSTSDNSDPNTNGKQYTYYLTNAE